jgi:uncharacterized lipoprotein
VFLALYLKPAKINEYGKGAWFMKKSTSLLLACLVMLGTSACSTAQKQEDQTADITSSGDGVAQEESTDAFTEPSATEESAEVASAEPAPAVSEPVAEMPPEAPAELPSKKSSRSSTTSNYSLGAGSSGRGH